MSPDEARSCPCAGGGRRALLMPAAARADIFAAVQVAAPSRGRTSTSRSSTPRPARAWPCRPARRHSGPGDAPLDHARRQAAGLRALRSRRGNRAHHRRRPHHVAERGPLQRLRGCAARAQRPGHPAFIQRRLHGRPVRAGLRWWVLDAGGHDRAVQLPHRPVPALDGRAAVQLPRQREPPGPGGRRRADRLPGDARGLPGRACPAPARRHRLVPARQQPDDLREPEHGGEQPGDRRLRSTVGQRRRRRRRRHRLPPGDAVDLPRPPDSPAGDRQLAGGRVAARADGRRPLSRLRPPRGRRARSAVPLGQPDPDAAQRQGRRSRRHDLPRRGLRCRCTPSSSSSRRTSTRVG